MNRWDLLVIAGMLFAAAGIGVIYWPAGLIAFGVGIGGLGVAGALADAKAPRPGGKP